VKNISTAVITLLVTVCIVLTCVTARQHQKITVLENFATKMQYKSKLDSEMIIFIARDYNEFKEWVLKNETVKRHRFGV
jgi:hypothetical protein